MMNKRKSIPKKIRLLVYEKCNHRCGYCGCEIEYKDMQVDHAKPLRIGADRIRNMSDEELLDFICSIETYEEGSVKTIGNGVSMHTVTEVREWLQSEAE